MNLLPRPIKRRWRRKIGHHSCLYQLLSPFLPEVLCVDVGASYFPHAAWRLFLESEHSHWIAVDPNAANLEYLENWPYPCRVEACTSGLSHSGGPHPLYVTNIDSGSSLLEPVASQSSAHRRKDLDYFFPVQKKQIVTTTLAELVDSNASKAPVIVKLDTQGTELDILLGAQSHLEDHRIVGIELEATLLAEPFYRGSGKFSEAFSALTNLGYELLHIDPISFASRHEETRARGRRAVNECDAIFSLRSDLAEKLSANHRLALLGFYATNRFYEESLALLERDTDLKNVLRERGGDPPSLADQLKKLI